MRCTASRFQDHNPCVSWPNSGVDRLADERGLRVAGPIRPGEALISAMDGLMQSKVECG